jgi:hypothetical protein
MRIRLLLLIAVVPALLPAAEPPSAEISNGLVKARLYLPDVQNGYYRGTRFDWSGVIASLEYAGHSYFGPWSPMNQDPTGLSSISGPVEEWRSNGSALNYDDARPGETFIKFGAGVLLKPEEAKYAFGTKYQFVDHGKWSVRTAADRVEFTQELTDPKSGYGYVYTKTVRLAAGKPQLMLEHTIRNTGRKTIDGTVFDHNFFVIDGQPTGPDFTVTFPFAAKAEAPMTGLAEVRGNQVVYLKPLEEKQTASSALTGYSQDPKDYDIRVENHKTGAGVHISGDHPLTRIFFWSIRTTVCPEATISYHVEPGKDFSYSMTYDFYTLPAAGR